MNILVIGDVTSPAGVEHLRAQLWRVRRETATDFCVVNGENAAFITGISPEQADTLLRAGADAITGGNHTLRNARTLSYLDMTEAILRPLNYGADAPGHGAVILPDAGGRRVLVLSAMGNIHMEPVLDSPFPYLDRALRAYEGQYDVAVLDIHAEATGEKAAVAYAYDGRIHVIFGTHTHVQTADDRVLPGGTGYLSDVGMCGESEGILGMDPEVVIARTRTHMSHRFAPAAGAPRADACLFVLDDATYRVRETRRFSF